MNILPSAWRALSIASLGCAVCFSGLGQMSAQTFPVTSSESSTPQTGSAQASTSSQPQSGTKAATPAKKLRRRRRYTAGQVVVPRTPSSTAQPVQVAPTAEQRARDQRILELQKAQSARIARENDATTKAVVKDQQRVQAEPRIQDAPGVNDQPLPGAAVVPPSQPTEQPRIQDAPGPAQTLPKPAPVTPSSPQ